MLGDIKTEQEATRKLSHMEGEERSAAMAGQWPLVPAEPSTASVGFDVGRMNRSEGPRGLAALEAVMKTPEEVLLMRQLLERRWSRRRIAAGLRSSATRWIGMGLPRFRGQVSRLHTCECSCRNKLLLVVDRADVTER
jgi:hypothetical protein